MRRNSIEKMEMKREEVDTDAAVIAAEGSEGDNCDSVGGSFGNVELQMR